MSLKANGRPTRRWSDLLGKPCEQVVKRGERAISHSHRIRAMEGREHGDGTKQRADELLLPFRSTKLQ